MQFFPGSPQVSVGAAVEAHGAEFFRLASLTAPCGVDGVINVQQYPVIPNCNAQNLCPPGTFDIAVTPDGEYAFVANEYGLMPSPTPPTEKGGGTIGVIRLERDDFGRFTSGSQVGTIYVPGGNTIPGITMSHDGKYLYVTCEGSADGINPQTLNPYRDPTNVRSTSNGPVLCPGCRTNAQACDNESKGRNANNGLLTVIDVAKATSYCLRMFASSGSRDAKRSISFCGGAWFEQGIAAATRHKRVSNFGFRCLEVGVEARLQQYWCRFQWPLNVTTAYPHAAAAPHPKFSKRRIGWIRG
jgi:hypothetical protein